MGKIDTSGWKEFRVGELFEKLNLRFLPNRVFDKASDISEVKSEEALFHQYYSFHFDV